MKRSFPLFLVLLVPLMLGKNKCKKDVDDLDDGDDVVINDVEVTLQVVSVRPATIEPSTPVVVKLFGAGFEEGGAVKIDQEWATTKFIDENSLSVSVPAMQPGVYDVTVTNPDGQESTLRSGLSVNAAQNVESCRLLRVYFELDSAGLSSDARQLLGDEIECLNRSSAAIQVDGHADERGTTDYNVALGQRRAMSVQRYLASLGVASTRLNVTSYGEEQPLDAGHTQAAWGKNRRVEVRLRD